MNDTETAECGLYDRNHILTAAAWKDLMRHRAAMSGCNVEIRKDVVVEIAFGGRLDWYEKKGEGDMKENGRKLRSDIHPVRTTWLQSP